MGTDYTYGDIAKMIDHSILKPELTDTQMEEGCGIAVDYDVASCCMRSDFLARGVSILSGSTVVPSTVIDFPLGGSKTSIRVVKVKDALNDAAPALEAGVGVELDVVVKIGWVKSGLWDLVKQDLQKMSEIIHAAGGKIKVIFENHYLTDEEKVKLCQICCEVGVNWVKTGTGFTETGATDEDLTLMVENVTGDVEVKAAGKVRTLDRLLEVRKIGVTRAGATATQVILDEVKSRLG